MPNEQSVSEPVVRALRVLKESEDEDASLGPASEVEARLMGEVRALRRAYHRRLGGIVAVAAACVLFVLFGFWQRPRSRGESRPATITPTVALADPGDPLAGVTDFLPIGTGGPVQMGIVIRVTLPESAFAALGVATSGATQADLLVGDDGLAHAIRLVR
jgi:hypothetical protein